MALDFWKAYRCQLATVEEAGALTAQLLAIRGGLWLGTARKLCPGSSDGDFLRNLNGVTNPYAEIANSALNFGVTKKQLNGA